MTNKHGAGRLHHHLSRNTAEEQLAENSPRAALNNDQVGMPSTRERHYYLSKLGAGGLYHLAARMRPVATKFADDFVNNPACLLLLSQ